jgi:hypothetical protein
MLVYLFRRKLTNDLAVTTDMTGRNIPAVTSSTDWLFVEALDTSKFANPWRIADLQEVHRGLRAFGYHIFGADC